jgi:membrane-associated phospholipid phosphatase
MPHDSSPTADDTDAVPENASGIEKADIALGATLASERDHPLVKAAGEADKLGDQAPLYALSGAVLIAGIASRNLRLADSGVSMLAAIAAADLSKRLTKALVTRTRPHVFLDEAQYDADTGGSAEKPEQSFPSGHTAGSVAVARALSRNFPAAGAAAGTAAVGIGISRIAKGAHWPLDVLGGAVIGLAAEAIAATLLRSAASALLKRRVCVALLKHRQ